MPFAYSICHQLPFFAIKVTYDPFESVLTTADEVDAELRTFNAVELVATIPADDSESAALAERLRAVTVVNTKIKAVKRLVIFFFK